VQRHRVVGPARAHRLDQRPDLQRIGGADGVAEIDAARRSSGLLADTDKIGGALQRLGDRDVALVIAAEGGEEIDRPAPQTVLGIERPQLALALELLLGGRVVVARQEGVRRAARGQRGQAETALGGLQEALGVEPHAAIGDAFALADALGDLRHVGHLRHHLRVHEGGAVDLGHAGLGQRLDQADLLRGRDARGFRLEPLAGALLDDVHLARKLAHAALLSARSRPAGASLRRRPCLPWHPRSAAADPPAPP